MSADLKVTGCQECFTAAWEKLHWNVGDKIFSVERGERERREERDEAMLGQEGGGILSKYIPVGDAETS